MVNLLGEQGKKNIYIPTVPYFMEKYNLDRVEVLGIFIGARGVITSGFDNFRRLFKIPVNLREDIVLSTIKKSCHILNHYFSPKQ